MPGSIEAVILARSGSKGLPGKNVRQLCGRPLIAYAIEAACLSSVSRTWVSTDGDEIAKVARDCGADVINRPSELATDASPSEEALLHFISERSEVEILVFIQPTSPLIKADQINLGIEMVKSQQYDSVFSGYTKDWEAEFDERMEPLNWDFDNRPRRQDVGPIYVENGAFYVTTREQLIRSKRRYGGRLGFVPMSQIASLQIDRQEDFEFAVQLIESGYLR